MVQLVGDFDRYGHCIVDNSRNLLILHPDHLISSTVVGDSFTCVRKAVLEDRVKATSDANQSTIYGHMLHELFQEAMRVNRWDDVWMATAIKGVVARHLEELFEINLDQTVAIDHITGRATELQAWAEVFIAPKPKVNFDVISSIGYRIFEADILLENIKSQMPSSKNAMARSLSFASISSWRSRRRCGRQGTVSKATSMLRCRYRSMNEGRRGL